MNIKEYISSGVIETYVMGLASKEEILELENLTAQYPEIRQALREAEDALLGYARLHAEEAPVGTKEKIRDVLFNPPIQPQQNDTVSQDPRSNKDFIGKTKFSTSIAIAASLLLILSIGYHLLSIKDYRNKIAALEQQNLQLIAQNKTYITQLEQAKDDVNTLANPALQSILLTGIPGHETSQATLFWNNATHEVYLMLINLPKLPEGKQYQLWAIVDGKPVNAGLYNDQLDKRLQKMIPMKKADMFAITIEDEGGSAQPTMEQMVVAGKV